MKSRAPRALSAPAAEYREGSYAREFANLAANESQPVNPKAGRALQSDGRISLRAVVSAKILRVFGANTSC